MIFSLGFVISGAALFATGMASTAGFMKGWEIMLREVNNARAKSGRPPLCISEKLMRSAQKHSDYMANLGPKGTLTHDENGPFPGSRFSEFSCMAYAENVAQTGNDDVVFAAKIIDDDPPHHENVVGDYTHFGAGLAINPGSKKYYYTQHFAKSKGSEKCFDGSTPSGTSTSAPSAGSTQPQQAQQQPQQPQKPQQPQQQPWQQPQQPQQQPQQPQQPQQQPWQQQSQQSSPQQQAQQQSPQQQTQQQQAQQQSPQQSPQQQAQQQSPQQQAQQQSPQQQAQQQSPQQQPEQPQSRQPATVLDAQTIQKLRALIDSFLNQLSQSQG